MIIYSSKVTGAYKIKLLPVALISNAYKGDAGLKAHELQHIKQYCVMAALGATVGTLAINWFAGVVLAVVLHDAAYTFIRKYRLWAEVSAFRRQLMIGGSVELAARALADNYDLDITYSEALKRLS